MPDVRRFTTRYSAAEDRVRLAVEMDTDEVRIFWLTRRLLNRLLPRLLQRLNQAPSTQAAPVAQAQVAQRFSQQAAVSTLETQKDVPTVPSPRPDGRPAMAVVVTTLDIRHTRQGVVLDLKGADEVLLSLPFGENELRQWMNVLYRQYEAGDWHEGFWPDWIRPAPQAAADTRLN